MIDLTKYRDPKLINRIVEDLQKWDKPLKIMEVCGEYVDEIENYEGEYPNVYDWKLKIGLRSPKTEDKLTDVEIKEKKILFLRIFNNQYYIEKKYR